MGCVRSRLPRSQRGQSIRRRYARRRVLAREPRQSSAPGFYDGDGVYRVRFMPDAEGEWTYRTRSNVAALDGLTGAFRCGPPSAGNHGPVRVRNRHHFAYADGAPYFPFGTTCYAWTHQPLDMQRQTLDTMRASGFNKLRMAVFPKHYIFNENEPLHDIYERGEDGALDFDRPNVVAFRHFETQVAALGAHGRRSGHHRLPPLRSLGLLHDVRRAGRPLRALSRRAARRLSQRLVVARQRI